VYGWALRKILQAWGYPISAGSLYPLLNVLECEGLLQGHTTMAEGRERKYYQITERGRAYYSRLCREAMPMLREIFPELTTEAI
jgi:DNA-binding PadR family transcriptional regulator